MTVVIYRRLSRTRSNIVPDAALSGELVLLGESRVDGSTTVDGLLVDDGEDHCVVELGGTAPPARIRVLQGDSTPSLETAVEIAEELTTLESLDFSWREATDVTAPILSQGRVSELLERSAVETELDGRLPHLKQVFFAPATELRATPERVPVARARRISRRATQVLSARTQDWLRMSASGVTPRVVESIVRDEIVDLYENRVAARLLDAVGTSLAQSLARLDELAELLGGDHHVLMGWWRKQQRLASLWGQRSLNDDHRAAVDQRRKELGRLLRSVSSMRGGPLYKGVPRRARVAFPIRITNLLGEDFHYRSVRSLWATWWHARSQVAAPAERRAKRLKEAEAFDVFAMLLIRRCLRSLEDPGSPSQEPLEQETLRVQTKWGQLRLSATSESVCGDWTLSRASLATDALVPSVRAVTLPVELLEGSDPAIAEGLAALRNETARIRDGSIDTIVVYPGTSHALRALPPELTADAYRVPLALQDRLGGRTWVMPVSPLDIESEERLGRAIRWGVFAPLFYEYPMKIDFPPASRVVLGGAGFVDIGSSIAPITLVRPASVEELRTVDDHVRQEVHRLDARLQGGGHHAAKSLRDAVSGLHEADARGRRLQVCPVCQQTGAFHRRGAATFECVCACGSRWGLWHDALTNDRIPYLWVDDEPDDVDSTLRGRWLGVDVLAEPCVHPAVRYRSGLINPESGRCTESARWGSTCPRCSGTRPRTSSSVSRGF